MKRLKGVLAIIFAVGLLPLLVTSMAFAGEKVLRIGYDAADLVDLHPHFAQTTQDGRLPRTVAPGRFSSAKASWSIRGGTIQGTS